MRRRLATILGLGAILSASALWLIAAPVVSAGDPCYHGYEMPLSSSLATTTVVLEPCAFAPTLTSVPIGATVTFRNGTDFTHLITGANQDWGSRDAEVAPGKTVIHTFASAGIYPYSCALHRGMSGAVIVGGAEAVAAAVVPAAAVGSTPGSTTGSTTTSATSPTTTETVASSTVETLPLVVGAALAGFVIGGLGAWLLGRRRTAHEGSAVARIA